MINLFKILIVSHKLGCHMYGKECKSWNGKMHVKCRVPEELSFSDSFVCTLPTYNEKNNSSACRKCEDENNWRCDDGYCIPKEKYRDGIPHCEDGSDEKPGMFNEALKLVYSKGKSMFDIEVYFDKIIF